MPALGQTNEGLGLTNPQPAEGVLATKGGGKPECPSGQPVLKDGETRTLGNKARNIDSQNDSGSRYRDTVKGFFKNVHHLLSPS